MLIEIFTVWDTFCKQLSVSYHHLKKSHPLFGQFQMCPLCSGDTNLWPQWLCWCVTRLSLSVVAYWSSLELSVFILTSACINTPVTREQSPSDQITSSIKQTPLCGFGTQRSRPLAGGFSQRNSGSGSESEWLPAKQKHNNDHRWSADWESKGDFPESLTQINRGKEWSENKSLKFLSR